MESNFIKERIVVRERIIKENLDSTKKSTKTTSRSIAAESVEKSPEKLFVLEELVNEKLKTDLVNLSTRVDTICQTIADYLKVKSALKILKKSPKNVKLQTNIGCNFYAQCHIEDASMIHLCVGLDIYLLMTIDDAIKMIEIKERQWSKELDALQERASKIKAYIKIALETMGKFYDH